MVESSFAEVPCRELRGKVLVLGAGGVCPLQGQVLLTTHFSSFVLDMMSSFQFTKIKAISPSVRKPDSTICF